MRKIDFVFFIFITAIILKQSGRVRLNVIDELDAVQMFHDKFVNVEKNIVIRLQKQN
jgi:hypothetical protein